MHHHLIVNQFKSNRNNKKYQNYKKIFKIQVAQTIIKMKIKEYIDILISIIIKIVMMIHYEYYF